MRTSVRIGVAAAALALAWAARADDWPQWRGPNGDNASKEKGLLKTWPGGGPALAWTSEEAGTGFGGPAVVGDRVYILGALKDDKGKRIEHVIALDQKSGKKLWAVPIGEMWDFAGNSWSAGPNSTPAVDGKLLYALGSQGVLVCVDTDAKAVKWRKDLIKDLKAEVNDVTCPAAPTPYGWGFSWSPFVDGDNLIIAPGGPDGLLAALKKDTGALVWRSKDVADQATYSSPIKAVVEGVTQYIYVAQEKVYGVAAKDGALLWTYEKERTADEIVAPTPIYHDGLVFITASKAGAEVIKLTKAGAKFTAEIVGKNNKKFGNFHGGIVRIDKHVYGSNEVRSWKCIDFATGEDVWESGGAAPGAGALTYADGHLYCLSQDDGTVSLVEASPKAFSLVSKYVLPKKSLLRKVNARVWTHPVVANGCLYLRDQELVFCYKVK